GRLADGTGKLAAGTGKLADGFAILAQKLNSQDPASPGVVLGTKCSPMEPRRSAWAWTAYLATLSIRASSKPPPA
ncbi:hypothetical protein, partial [Arthrobacter sp. Hiyo1]|uniref:hypothetical protein n=1 Tax=Arthrobacter sp. Hiyo1 TaxID=1588020 RepID=UPI00209C5F6C